MSESFRPVSNTPPDTVINKFKFYGRMILDLQILTIFKDVRASITSFKGNILDVGCGQSPYKFLLRPQDTKYYGIDIEDADKFDYRNSDITPFDGEEIPFANDKFDGLICTEVLEHVYHYQKLIDEIYRVMKKGGVGIITIPWSARNHYIPFDYFRYTPSSIKIMFSQFSIVEISSRGTDITNIANKLIVIWSRGIVPFNIFKFILTPLWIISLPFLGMVVFLAHLSLTFNIGSQNDPLGYTIRLEK